VSCPGAALTGTNCCKDNFMALKCTGLQPHVGKGGGATLTCGRQDRSQGSGQGAQAAQDPHDASLLAGGACVSRETLLLAGEILLRARQGISHRHQPLLSSHGHCPKLHLRCFTPPRINMTASLKKKHQGLSRVLVHGQLIVPSHKNNNKPFYIAQQICWGGTGVQ